MESNYPREREPAENKPSPMAIVATIVVAYLINGILQLTLLFIFDLLSGHKVGGLPFPGLAFQGPLFIPANYSAIFVGGLASGAFAFAVFKSTHVVKIMLFVWLVLSLFPIVKYWEYYYENRVLTPVIYLMISLISTGIGGRLIRFKLSEPNQTKP